MNKLGYLKEILYLLGDKRKALPWLVCLFTISSLLELAGLGLIAPYMLMIVNPEALNEGIVGKLTGSIDASLSRDDFILILSLTLLVLFITKVIFAILINRKIIKFSLNLRLELTSLLMKSYQNLNYIEYLRRNSSEYIYTINTLTGQFSNGIVQNFLKMISEGISALVIVGMLVFANGPVLALLLTLIICIGYGYDRFFKHNIKDYGKKANEHDIRMVQGINEGIEGIKEIRILGCEKYFHNIVVDNSKHYSHYSAKTQFIRMTPRYLFELMSVAFIVFLVIGTILLNQNLGTLAPTISLFGFALIRLIPSANVLTTGLSHLRHGRDSTSRLYRDLRKIDLNSELSCKNISVSSSPESFKLLTFKHVCFHYPEVTGNALNNIALSIHEGDSIGLIGTSGSGKTTLVDTMLGLLEPQKGDIEFNNKPLHEMLADWRANAAYLPQEVLLIDNTLRHNVALGVPDNDIDENKLQDALEQSRLVELVNQLPDGLNTVLGERGVRLSGGQKQRVAIARAFYHDRNVLIMDEATSALDNETEHEIVEEIKCLKGRKTLIVIAHRLTTVQYCDRIFRLEDGGTLEEVTYDSVAVKT